MPQTLLRDAHEPSLDLSAASGIAAVGSGSRFSSCQLVAAPWPPRGRPRVTLEEREEYEPHLEAGSVVFAGVDYAAILARAEVEADVLVWDGGNNDLPFFVPTLHLCLVDPHRAGHESRYHPGEANLRLADVAVIVKEDTAPPAAVEAGRGAIRALIPRARILMTGRAG